MAQSGTRQDDTAVGVDAQADEETLVVPASWRSRLHQRRSGLAVRTARPSQKDAVAAVGTLVTNYSLSLREILDNPRSDPKLVRAALGWLAELGHPLPAVDFGPNFGRGTSVSVPFGSGAGLPSAQAPDPASAELALGAAGAPLAAAAVAAVVCHQVDRHWTADGRSAVLAEVWLAARGAVFAACAVAELGGLAVRPGGHGISRSHGYHLVRVTPNEQSSAGFASWLPVARRVRAHLAGLAEAEYVVVVDALAGYRGGDLRQRALVSYLVPTQADWVDEDCADLGRAGCDPDSVALPLLLAASTAAQVAAIRPLLSPWQLARRPGWLETVTDGLGVEAAAAEGAARLDDKHLEADARGRLLTTLAVLPSDRAFQALLDQAGDQSTRRALRAATARFPRRALRLLSAAATDTTVAARAAADLLRVHVAANPELVAALLPTLPADGAEHVERLVAELAAATAPVAPAELVPAVLRTPPWAAPRRLHPLVIDGLVAPEDASMTWLLGEQASWATAGRRPYGTRWDQKTWPERVAAYQRGQLRWDEAELFATGPDELVRPLLADWRPATFWQVEARMPALIARFELDALPVVLRTAPANWSTGLSWLLPYDVLAVATVVADCHERLKSVRGPARAWLRRHPETAALALVPPAVGKAGKARRTAENVLVMLAADGFRDQVLAAARRYDSDHAGPGAAAAAMRAPGVVAAVEVLLDADPLLRLPARIPALPGRVEPAALPQVLLRDRKHALPVEAARHLAVMLAMSRPEDPYAGLAIVREACDPESLAAFGWALFNGWRAAGEPSKEGWALDVLGLVGDDETARRLAPVIRAWPGEGGHTKAVRGLDALAGIGTDVALMHLHGISQRVAFKALRDRVAAKIADVADALGLTPEQLADRLVPDLGLDPAGTLTLDYGPRRFVVGFDEQLRPYVTDEAGKRRKDLPKPGARDDAERAPAAHKRFAALKKDVRTLAADQLRRFEEALVLRRRWTVSEFETGAIPIS